MDGKTKCSILRGIRQKLAEANDIAYEPHPCHNRGNCLGTCPMCDSELLWLDLQINKRRQEGYPIFLLCKELENPSQNTSECTSPFEACCFFES